MKKLLKSVSRYLGLEVLLAGRAPSWEYTFSLLKKKHFNPRTIIDIGVASGTPVLYATWPEAAFVLVDPLKESLPIMESLAKRMNARVFNVALGDRKDRATIDVRPELGGSTLLEERGHKQSVTSYEVPVERLDSLIERKSLEGPCLCKIDVQGAELMVLRGMTGLLDAMDLLIIEVSLIDTLVDAPIFHDIDAFLSGHGFVLYDILDLGRRPLDGALGQMDVVYCKKDSALRSDRRWASHPDQ
jgi:FkbM family methyltransferase